MFRRVLRPSTDISIQKPYKERNNTNLRGPFLVIIFIMLKHKIYSIILFDLSVQNLLSSSLLSKNKKIKNYRTIILPVVFYGCRTWWLTLREEHGLRMFENRVLRRIFGPKRDLLKRKWRKLYNEELNDINSSNIAQGIKSSLIKWAGHVARMGKRRGAYRGLVGKPDGKGPLGRRRRRWEDNVKINLQEVGWRTWTELIWF